LLLAWLIALAAIDLDTMTLPNPLTSSGLVLGVVFQTFLGYQETQTIAGAVQYFMGSIGGMVLGIWIYDIIQILGTLLMGQLAQGGGDAKLMGMVGAWLGWSGVVLTGGMASFVGSGQCSITGQQPPQVSPRTVFSCRSSGEFICWRSNYCRISKHYGQYGSQH
jgi:leader peptidase (prepilin peptidase) / N-methyltransferase